jgi:hypothetical protein
MRYRKPVILGACTLLAVIAILLVSLWLFGGPQPPEFGLLSYAPNKGYDPGINPGQYKKLFELLPELSGEETFIAQFQIRVRRPESGATLEPLGISYEIFGANRELIDKGVWHSQSFGPLGFAMRPFAINPKLILPEQARSVRFTVTVRPPTLRQRSQMFFHKIGFHPRYPKATRWISESLPNSPRRLQHIAEVDLPPFPPATQ